MPSSGEYFIDANEVFASIPEDLEGQIVTPSFLRKDKSLKKTGDAALFSSSVTTTEEMCSKLELALNALHDSPPRRRRCASESGRRQRRRRDLQTCHSLQSTAMLATAPSEPVAETHATRKLSSSLSTSPSLLDSSFSPTHARRSPLPRFNSARNLHPAAGDIIEFDRTVYSYWGLYVGDGLVVHVAAADGSDLAEAEAVVCLSPLEQIARSSSVRVNNKEVGAASRGYSTLSVEACCDAARQMIGLKVPHNLVTCNSEHYVTSWKYSKSWSDQADAALLGVRAMSKCTTEADLHTVMMNSYKTLLHTPTVATARKSSK